MLHYLNHRAIKEGLWHNRFKITDQKIKNIINDASPNNVNSLTYAQVTTLLSYLSNDDGSIMPSIKDNYIRTTYRGNNNVIVTQGNEYDHNTLYVKREKINDANTIVSLTSFSETTILNNLKTAGLTDIFNIDKVIITHDITNHPNYTLVNSANNVSLDTSSSSDLVIKYANSYGNENYITIKVTHKIRSGSVASNNNKELTWDQVDMVTDYYGLSSYNTSTLYGYFFVDKNY
jgi:hypothetical protein